MSCIKLSIKSIKLVFNKNLSFSTDKFTKLTNRLYLLIRQYSHS